jgi:hypothetical protein
MKEEKPEAPKNVRVTKDEEGNNVITWNGGPIYPVDAGKYRVELVGERGPELITFEHATKFFKARRGNVRKLG